MMIVVASCYGCPAVQQQYNIDPKGPALLSRAPNISFCATGKEATAVYTCLLCRGSCALDCRGAPIENNLDNFAANAKRTLLYCCSAYLFFV